MVSLVGRFWTAMFLLLLLLLLCCNYLVLANSVAMTTKSDDSEAPRSRSNTANEDIDPQYGPYRVTARRRRRRQWRSTSSANPQEWTQDASSTQSVPFLDNLEQTKRLLQQQQQDDDEDNEQPSMAPSGTTLSPSHVHNITNRTSPVGEYDIFKKKSKKEKKSKSSKKKKSKSKSSKDGDDDDGQDNIDNDGNSRCVVWKDTNTL